MAVKYVKEFEFGGSVSHKKPPGMKKDLAPSKPFKGAYEGYARGGKVKMLDKIMREHREEMPVRAAMSAQGMPARARPNAPAQGAARMESRPVMGRGQGYAAGGQVGAGVSRQYPRKPATREAPEPLKPTPRTQEQMTSVEMIEAALRAGLKPGTKQFSNYIAADNEKRAAILRGLGSNLSLGARPVPKSGSYMPETAAAYLRPKKVSESENYEEDLPSAMKREATGYAKGGKVAKVMREYKKGELHSGSKKGPVVKNPKQAIAIALSEARKAGAKIPKKAKGGEIIKTEYMAYGDKKVPYRGSPKKAKMLGRQDRRAREAMERAEKYAPGLSLDMPGKKMENYAHGGMAKGGFPDLTGDGKVTRADVLKGRGVFKKGGMAAYRRKPMYGGGK